MRAVEEYLASHFDPDCDFVDGAVKPRAAAEFEHGRIQRLLGVHLHLFERQAQIWAATETRVQVRPDRFRVPDLCVISSPVRPVKIQVAPPFLCVEILSPADSLDSIQERVDDYLSMGVPFTWVISPKLRRAWIHTAAGVRDVRDGFLRTANPDLAIPLSALFDDDGRRDPPQP